MSANATVPDTTGGPTFAEIFGPVFWGFCVSLILAGVSALQGYLYFTRYNDKFWVRAVAAMMLVLDFTSMALICQSMYYYMLPHFGSFAPLGAVTSELNVECLISAVITFTSQMYFVYQLYMVKSTGMTAAVMKALIIVFGMVGLSGAIGCVAMMFMYPHSIFANRNHVFAVLAGIAKGFGAAADIIATIAMCMFLKSADTGIKRTSSMLKSLMHLVINRGILVTAAQILLLITFFATAGHLYWLAVHINTTKLYVNTFFGMLNARTSLQERYAPGHMSLSGDTTAYSQRLVAAASPASPKTAAHEKFGELDTQNYAMGAIRVTTSSTVADI
ncbi:hypothetical protein B0H14DRAFT_3876328 [Mycena olivaceomarginata]|nr:hypothetical protein B0H14DRAFT_3876328 [Mycena olivaceomarginata]